MTDAGSRRGVCWNVGMRPCYSENHTAFGHRVPGKYLLGKQRGCPYGVGVSADVSDGKLVCSGKGTKTNFEYQSENAEPDKTVDYTDGSADFSPWRAHILFGMI